jgi:hypothetical protein
MCSVLHAEEAISRRKSLGINVAACTRVDLRTTLLVATTAALVVRPAQAANLGAACEAPSECDSGLYCVANVCSDEATLTAHRSKSLEEDRINPWIRGGHGFLGATVGAALTAPSVASAQFAVRGGLIWDGLQLLLEVSPGSTVFIGSQPFGMFEATANIGGLIPITRSLAWILRIGGGGGFVFACCANQPSHTPAFGEFRLDLLGMAIRASEHLVVEVLVPSFRLAAGRLASSELIAQWMATTTLEYVF